jgi:hypothetical protein
MREQTGIQVPSQSTRWAPRKHVPAAASRRVAEGKRRSGSPDAPRPGSRGRAVQARVTRNSQTAARVGDVGRSCRARRVYRLLIHRHVLPRGLEDGAPRCRPIVVRVPRSNGVRVQCVRPMHAQGRAEERRGSRHDPRPPADALQSSPEATTGLHRSVRSICPGTDQFSFWDGNEAEGGRRGAILPF